MSDNEQVDALKEWWQQNGKVVVLGTVLGVGSVFGWRGWQNYQEQQAASASTLYDSMVMQLRQEQAEQVDAYARQLIEDYPRTAYANFAALTLAKLATDDYDYETATEHLRWAVDNSRHDSIMHVARLRLIQALLAQDKTSAALQQIDNVRQPGKFQAHYEELRGDVLFRQGDLTAARDAYQLAMANSTPGAGHYEILELKLDNLGRPETGSTL